MHSGAHNGKEKEGSGRSDGRRASGSQLDKTAPINTLLPPSVLRKWREIHEAPLLRTTDRRTEERGGGGGGGGGDVQSNAPCSMNKRGRTADGSCRHCCMPSPRLVSITNEVQSRRKIGRQAGMRKTYRSVLYEGGREGGLLILISS